MTLIDTARIFATAAHAAVGQKRKYTGEDYIVHPTEVALTVASITDDEVMIAAALLHDVLEDTAVTPDQLKAVVGEEVTELVLWLTDVSKPDDGNRAVRKAIDRQHTAAAPARAKTIKLADLISNTRSIVTHDPGFAKTYMVEKRELLKHMKDAHPGLYAIAVDLVDAYFG